LNCPLPQHLAGLGAIACLACCALPALLAAGILAGAGWATTDRWLPAVAVGLLIAANGTWHLTRRRGCRTNTGCQGGACACRNSNQQGEPGF
jgi:hypothetical protein